MTSHKTTQTMKPATAAKKLGVYLEATPPEFQEGVVSRDVSIGGLSRGGITEALTTEQIEALKTENPDWLVRERATHAEVRKETVRVKEKEH
jgi:hypothetical protein